jgi:pimeloyl-ACP methyl ester carboxylesterase
MRALGLGGRFPLVRQALRRRARFDDAEQAFAYWRPKPLFAGWSDEALRLYVEGMTTPAPDGGLTLAWSPRWEARIYQTILTSSWREPARLRRGLPVLVVRGTQTNTYVAASDRRMRRLLPEAAHVALEGEGHLFPQAAPDRTRQVIEAWLAGLQPAAEGGPV